MSEIEKRSIGGHLEYLARIGPMKDCFISNVERVTFGEFNRLVDALAKGLLKLGINKGEKVSLWMPNRLHWLLAQFAIARIGAILVPLSTRFKVLETEYILRQSDSSTLIMVDNFLNIDFINILNEIAPEAKASSPGNTKSNQLPCFRNIIVDSGRAYPGTFRFEELLQWGSGSDNDEELERAKSSVDPDDIAVIAYTSGTTGSPKGAMLTHDGISRHPFLMGQKMGLDEKDRILYTFPLYHLGGFAASVMSTMLAGACQLTTEYFDPEEAMRIIEKEKCTGLFAVHTMVQMMMEHPNFSKYDLRSLKKGLIGGAACPAKLLEEMIAKIGFKPLNSYGMTETSSMTTVTPPESTLHQIATTIGQTGDDYEIKVVDRITGEELPVGQTGELCVRGYTVMKGYYKKPEETAKVFDKDGWFHTGDIIKLDENGYLTFMGRSKDIIISGGENVDPVEVENFLSRHPKVLKAEVIGVPDKRLNEVVMAFIALKEGEKAQEDEIEAFCKGKIANFKIPKYVRFIDYQGFPTTSFGKVQKFKLREMALKELNLKE